MVSIFSLYEVGLGTCIAVTVVLAPASRFTCEPILASSSNLRHHLPNHLHPSQRAFYDADAHEHTNHARPISGDDRESLPPSIATSTLNTMIRRGRIGTLPCQDLVSEDPYVAARLSTVRKLGISLALLHGCGAPSCALLLPTKPHGLF
jgi:hypothetical protein